jgi:hypothetical protein
MDVLDRHGRLVVRYTPKVTKAEVEVALAFLGRLAVRRGDWQPDSRYSRALFPQRFSRIVGVGIDSKDIVLGRDLDRGSEVFDSDGYTVKSGVLRDPYTAEVLEYVQLADASQRIIEADHVVSLHDAFNAGAHAWKKASPRWKKFHSDVGNLLAVSRSVNASKSDQTAATWLARMPNQAFVRRLAIMQITTKDRYLLSVTEAEAEALRQALN